METRYTACILTWVFRDLYKSRSWADHLSNSSSNKFLWEISIFRLLDEQNAFSTAFSMQTVCFVGKLFRSCGAPGFSPVPLAHHKLHMWVKLGVSIYGHLGSQPLLERHFEILPCAVQYLWPATQESMTAPGFPVLVNCCS